jgi:hypothetical protein
VQYADAGNVATDAEYTSPEGGHGDWVQAVEIVLTVTGASEERATSIIRGRENG